MKLRLVFVFVLVILFHTSLYGQRFEMRDMKGMQWYKGNLHTHAREGESDSSVEFIVKWYKDRGYNFLAITDHSTITFPQVLTAQNDSSFILIPSEEVIGNGNKEELEINAFNIHNAIAPLHNNTVSSALQDCIDAVRQQNGVPMINHPNFNWRLGKDVLLNSKNCSLFELYNGYPGANNKGDETHPGLEEVWDFLLSSGKRIYGVASDDAHIYQKFSADQSNPGRGWVVVRAKSLDINEIMKNLESGLFYSSTGVEIEDLRVEPKRLEIIIKEKEGIEYVTEFIGSGGVILHSTKNNPARYNLSTDSSYVRARITDTDGRCAWIQPVFVIR